LIFKLSLDRTLFHLSSYELVSVRGNLSEQSEQQQQSHYSYFVKFYKYTAKQAA
jgi:hypothetical protein